MSPIKLNGSTSGFVALDAPAAAGSNTLVLPTGNGSSGQYLQTNGSGTLSWASVSGLPAQALTSGTAVASTSGTAIDFTGIPSTVKRITVMFSGVSTNGSDQYYLQLGTASSVESTGYVGSVAVSFSSVENYSSGASFQLITNFGGSASITVHGSVTLSLLNSATNLWTCSGVLGRSDNNINYMTAGSKTLSGVLTRLRITTLNGTNTFDAGTINIMYEG